MLVAARSDLQAPLLGAVLVLILAVVVSAADSEGSDFQATVAPVLERKCVACHQPGNRKGEFDLTTREGMLRGGDGGEALVPGRTEESPLYTRSIPHDGQPPEMPEKGDPLTDQEAADLRNWIAAGAPWPDQLVLKERSKADGSFWSFQPLADVQPPIVHDAPAGWAEHPIDRFVLARLAEENLVPNPPADPQTLIRRATYDLTGLPPTPEEVAAFLGEHEADPDRAYERLLDRLLASPRYGERWGRHWLDVIRFGESRGYERNEIITNLWPFRDYVIRSFNEDKPFDQFIREHLTGDVIGADSPEIEIGSAFLVAGPYDDVGNQDAEAAARIRADQIDEMIRATGEAFLGLTIGCARCHDHKFDPVSAADYYAWYATFAGTFHGPREVATETARRERSETLQPLQDQRSRLVAQKAELEKELANRAAQTEEEAAREWTRPRISRYGTEEVFEPVEAKFVRLTVEGTDSSDPNRTQFFLDEFEVWTDGEDSRNVALASAGATAQGASREARDFSGAYGVEKVIDGTFGERWHAQGSELLITLSKPERIHRVFFSSDRPRALPETHHLTTFVGDYRIDASLDGETWTEVAHSYDRLPPNGARKQARLLKRVTTQQETARLAELNRQITELDHEIARVPPLPVWWVGTHREAPGPFHVFVGGDPQRQGEPVLPASLEVLDSLTSAYRLDDDVEEETRRVALAEWITADDNPLTPRVLANRVWQYHFGTGIVATPSDFGYLGDQPTHPDLIDWLARELLHGGWRLKPIHRLIMTSRTYRQSGDWREAAAEQDAEGRLLWRFPPRRLSAEELRDTLLHVAGKLDLTMGGPGFRLYEYQQDNVATYVPLDEHGPETYRRSVYHHNARSSRVDLLSDFDCPDPSFAEPRRASTTTPAQALTMLNHSFSLDMAHSFAERIAREADDPESQLTIAFQLTFARQPSEPERRAGLKLIRTHGLRAVCRALLNSNELMHVN
jgi:mono/diheme cytochrome c family protein